MNEEQLINRLTTLANSSEVIADNIKVDKNIFKEAIELIDKLQKELKDSINARFELQRRIDKTQKENEELKEEIDELAKENEKWIDSGINYVKRHFKDYIHKDKIKAIVEKSYNDIDYFNRDIRKDLEDLLN